MLQKGDKAPDFNGEDDRGNPISLKNFSGKKIVLYFYPKDDTPGCTVEACSLRDVYDEILEKGAVVVGVSADSVKSHDKFKKKYDLPFFLLSDPDKKVIQAYGAWGEKKMYGKTSMGIIRSTFIIGPDGVIEKVFPKVTPKEHAAEIIESI